MKPSAKLLREFEAIHHRLTLLDNELVATSETASEERHRLRKIIVSMRREAQDAMALLADLRDEELAN
ncbi:MAG: hypothetical protein ABI837_21210 [Acidobacteriota bacterium]